MSVRKRSLETRLGILQVDRDEAVAAAKQEKEISDERARILSEQQRFVLERRWEVEQEEIRKQQALEAAQIQKDIAIIEEAKQPRGRGNSPRAGPLAGGARPRDRARRQGRRAGARGNPPRARARAGGSGAADSAGRKGCGAASRPRSAARLATQLEEMSRDIALISKEGERERTDIERFLGSRAGRARPRDRARGQDARAGNRRNQAPRQHGGAREGRA